LVPSDFSADVVFLVDGSFSVSQNHFNQEKSFVKSMAKTLNLSPAQTRAALVIYSTLPRTIAQLRGYTTQEFDGVVDRASLLGGTRRVDLAIDEAAKIFKTAGRKAKKIVVLLTAGRQTPGVKDLRTAMQPLRDIGADIYVMAIGSLPNIEELLPMVYKPKDIFRIPSYEVLSEHFKPVSAEIAKRAGKDKTTSLKEIHYMYYNGEKTLCFVFIIRLVISVFSVCGDTCNPPPPPPPPGFSIKAMNVEPRKIEVLVRCMVLCVWRHLSPPFASHELFADYIHYILTKFVTFVIFRNQTFGTGRLLS
jgi:hypothetical protein